MENEIVTIKNIMENNGDSYCKVILTDITIIIVWFTNRPITLHSRLHWRQRIQSIILGEKWV